MTVPAATPVPAIEARSLTCGYDGQAVLRDISFAVRPGEIFFVIGGSGCGKSTLLRSLIGITPPLAGEVRFGGQTFSDHDPVARRALLQTFGVLYQGGALWSSLTLRQNVALPLEEYTALAEGEIRELVALKLAQVGLTGFEDYYPAEISGGMKKRAGLAFHLFGTTLVVVSHELASIFSIADRVVMLDRGAQGIIAEGAPKELARNSRDPRVTEFLTRGDLLPQ